MISMQSSRMVEVAREAMQRLYPNHKSVVLNSFKCREDDGEIELVADHDTTSVDTSPCVNPREQVTITIRVTKIEDDHGPRL